ncbi:12181_t:CDS:2, partial [Acaulospora colombiana]
DFGCEDKARRDIVDTSPHASVAPMGTGSVKDCSSPDASLKGPLGLLDKGVVLAVRRDFVVWLTSLRAYAFSNVETWGLLADGQRCALNHLEKRCGADGSDTRLVAGPYRAQSTLGECADGGKVTNQQWELRRTRKTSVD